MNKPITDTSKPTQAKDILTVLCSSARLAYKSDAPFKNQAIAKDKASQQLYRDLLALIEGCEIDIEATTAHIESVGGSDDDILNMEIEADDRHDTLNDVRKCLATYFNQPTEKDS